MEKYNLLVFKALEFFIQNPYREIYLREFSRELKISPNSAQRFLDLFLREEFIREEKRANLRYFKANVDNIVFRFIKKTYSIDKLKKSGLINHLKDKFSNAILFGSVAKGLDEEDSDIDLVCIGKNKINFIEYEEKLEKRLNIHFFTRAEWKMQKRKNKAFYYDIIMDGINLVGEIPIIDENEN